MPLRLDSLGVRRVQKAWFAREAGRVLIRQNATDEDSLRLARMVRAEVARLAADRTIFIVVLEHDDAPLLAVDRQALLPHFNAGRCGRAQLRVREDDTVGVVVEVDDEGASWHDSETPSWRLMIALLCQVEKLGLLVDRAVVNVLTLVVVLLF